MKIQIQDNVNLDCGKNDHEPLKPHQLKQGCMGVIEFIIHDKHGNIVARWEEPNIVKIFGKEMLAHRLPSKEIWDPQASSGAGAWVEHEIDPTEEFAARYILLGASFDEEGKPVDEDPRYYTKDPATGSLIPIRLGPGAEFNGSLINAIPISEPGRPLKRIEEITFVPTYQPAGIPLLQDDVRAMNNVVKLQTTIKLDEYNGFGLTDSDFFVLTEIALAGGKKFDNIGTCECDPRKLFLDTPVPCIAGGGDVVSINPSFTGVDDVKEGDQIKVTSPEDTAGNTTDLDQVSPFYLILQKVLGGRDLVLDRTPVTSGNVPITGPVLVHRDTLRIFSHRILRVPIKKSADFEITCIWSIIFN
jgi:hypothetical protein